eukprot:2847266-Rhodomonas_salina.4
MDWAMLKMRAAVYGGNAAVYGGNDGIYGGTGGANEREMDWAMLRVGAVLRLWMRCGCLWMQVLPGTWEMALCVRLSSFCFPLWLHPCCLTA